MAEEKSRCSSSVDDAQSTKNGLMAGSTAVSPHAAHKRQSHLRRSRSRVNQPHPAVRTYTNDTDHEDAVIYPSRGQPVDCRLEDVVEKLKTKSKGSQTYPHFDSLEAYQVDLTTTQQMRQEEAQKLVDVAKNPAEPILPLSDGILTKITTGGNGYQILSLMARSISTALSLCLLDNECINAEHCPRLANQQRLERLVKQAYVAARCPLTDIMSFLPGSDHDDLIRAMFDIVDYVAAVLTRLISQTASGPFWTDNVIAVLAARIAKMKFLLMGLCESALVAAQNGADKVELMLNAYGQPSRNIDEEEEECEEALRIIEANTKDGLTTEDDAAVASYCINQSQYRSGINTALKHILLSLHFVGDSTLPAETFEICGIVYEIGFEGFMTVLFQDKDLQYSASSDRSVLNTAHPVLHMLNQTLRELAQQMNARPNSIGPRAESQTYVQWAYKECASGSTCGVDYTELHESSMSLRLRHLGDIVTATVPLSLMNSVALAEFTTYRNTMALAGGMQDVVSPFQESHFSAFCRLYTTRFDAEAKKQRIYRLSRAFERGQFSRCQLLPPRKQKIVHKERDNRQPNTFGSGKVIQDQFDDCCADMEHWMVDESSITVPCRLYVACAMAVAILFAVGGLTMGFTVGERIPGVDPFNLATYTWIVAAFILLIAKSVKVEHWAWRDFLSLRVRCCSVSELSSVTNMPEQLVIAKLLHDDCGGSILKTRGPYNSVFRNQGESGFSIDCPLTAATLMLSGLAILKVVAPRGEAIVCLDCRRGTYLSTIEHQGKQDKTQFVCDDLRQISPSTANRDSRPLKLKLRKGDFKWKRVQGLYDFKGQNAVFE